MAAPAQITDRAKRYRAQKVRLGKKVCAICGRKPARIDRMHLDGNEGNGEAANIAYGCRSCNGKLAAAFKSIGAGVPTNQYNPAAGHVPTFEQYAWAVSSGARDYYPNSTRHAAGVKDEAGAVIHATPKHKRVEYAKRIARKAVQTKRDRYDERWNPAAGKPYKTTPDFEFWLHGGEVYRNDVGNRGPIDITTHMPGNVRWESSKAHFDHFFPLIYAKRGNPPPADWLDATYTTGSSGKYAAHAARREMLKRGGFLVSRVRQDASGRYYLKYKEKPVKGNPAAASAEVFEEFHGHGPAEVVTVTKEVHTHGHLAAAGVLEKLLVMGIDRKLHSIEGFDGALLAFNERKNQLFIEGGDQSINLEDFGIRKPHERETLGKLRSIDYHTDKSHLGDEGGRATYTHEFRRTNKNGRHVKVKISRYPTLIYDVVNEALLISGGSYTIKAEGIDV